MNTLELFSLKGKTAIVTGGCGHLGHAMVAALADAGASVWVAGTSHDKFLRVFGTDTTLHFVKIDIMDSTSIREAFTKVAAEAGQMLLPRPDRLMC